MSVANKRRMALVLSGGGARGAYQAGVLQALAELCRDCGQADAFPILTGVSAGAINASFLASRSEDFLSSSNRLVEVWQGLNINQVFRTDLRAVSNIGWHWAKDIVSSGSMSKKRANFLLDASPLFGFLTENINFGNIQANIKQGRLEALALSATDYGNSENITFVSSGQPFPPWQRSRRISEEAEIGLHHVCASAAIPLFFAPVKIGTRYFGDGCLRNTAPLSPAIHLGADALLVIGVQHNPLAHNLPHFELGEPSIARILSVLLNSVLLDGVAIDVERLSRINNTLSLMGQSDRVKTGLRIVDCLHISPSQDISKIAYEEYGRLPRSIRYLVGGLGSQDDAGNLVSYLLFVSSYCRRLVELGYQDAKNRAEEITAFVLAKGY